MDGEDFFFGFLIFALVGIVIGGFAALIISTNNETKADRIQCQNTAKTLNSEQYEFDDSTNGCSIVTPSGKLVSF